MGEGDDLKSEDSSRSQTNGIAELKLEAKLASTLVRTATAKVRAAVAAEPTPKTIAELRAAASLMKKTGQRATKAFRDLLRMRDLSDEMREDHETRQMEQEAIMIECEYDIEVYLRQHDPESFAEENRRDSSSIQNESNHQPLNSTVNTAQAAKLSWKDILQRIPKFTGDPTKFKRWKDAFVLYVDSTPMDPLEKFQLMLKTIAGRVPDCIVIWDVSADNYKDARDTIFERYGNVLLAEEQHVRNVINACRKKDINTDGKIIEFIDTVTQSLASLVNLGGTYEGMSIFVTTVVTDALPFERKQRFDDIYDPEDGRCRLKALVEFLQCERNQLERLSKEQRIGQRPMPELRKNRFGLHTQNRILKL